MFRSEGATITEDDIEAIIARGETKTEELTNKLKEHTKGTLVHISVYIQSIFSLYSVVKGFAKLT